MNKDKIIGILVGVLVFFFLTPLIPETTCQDGWKSPSIGRQGACSHHGGVDRHESERLLVLIASIFSGCFVFFKLSSRDTNRDEENTLAEKITYHLAKIDFENKSISDRGWMHVMTSNSLEGFVKIGFTLKDPKLCVKELLSLDISNKYKLVYEILTINIYEVERKIQLSLKKYRYSKEWFKCSVSQAVKTIQSIVQEKKLYEKFYGEQWHPTNNVLCNHKEETESKNLSLEDYLKRKGEV